MAVRKLIPEKDILGFLSLELKEWRLERRLSTRNSASWWRATDIINTLLRVEKMVRSYDDVS